MRFLIPCLLLTLLPLHIQLSLAAEDPHRPAAINVAGVPVVDDSVVERLRQFQNVRGANFQSWAPDGKSVYLTTDARGEFRELARLDLKTGQYTWISDKIRWDVADVVVDPKSGQLAFTTNEDGARRLYLAANS